MNSEYSLAILGALTLNAALLENSDLVAGDFPEGRERATFQAITKVWEELREPIISLPLILVEVNGNGMADFLMKLAPIPSQSTPAAFASLVRRLRQGQAKQKLRRLFEAELPQMDKLGDVDPSKLQEIKAALLELEGLGGKQGFDPDKVLMTGTQIQALDIKVEWIVDRLIPKGAITVLHGPGGLGKSWLSLALSKAISEGLPFLGLPTKQRPIVYIDRENPMSVHKERVAKVDLRENYRAWHLSFDPFPPKLDGPDWAMYKSLPPGSLVFFDTCRACHDGKENDSDVAALVMGRLKEIRELDHEIILLHHTPRANDKASKGSTAWTDLADQTLAFYRNKRGTFEEIEEEGLDPNAQLFFGTGNKSRYERARFCVTFNPATGEFTLVEDPNAKSLDILGDFIVSEGVGHNQTEIITWAMKERVNPATTKGLRALLDRGANEGRWHTVDGLNRSKLYYPGGRPK